MGKFKYISKKWSATAGRWIYKYKQKTGLNARRNANAARNTQKWNDQENKRALYFYNRDTKNLDPNSSLAKELTLEYQLTKKNSKQSKIAS